MYKNEIKKLISQPLIKVVISIAIALVFMQAFYYASKQGDEQLTIVTMSDVSQKIDNLQSKKSSVLFNTSQQQLMLDTELEHYDKLSRLPDQMVNQKVKNQYLSFDIISLIFPVVVFVLMAGLYYEDIRYNLLNLFNANRLSLKHQFWVKALVLCTVLAVIVGLSILAFYLYLNLIQLDSHVAIHYFDGYIDSPIYLGIGAYYALIALTVMMGSIIMGFILLVLLLLFKNKTIALSAMSIILVASFLIDYFLSSANQWKWLKEINLINLLTLSFTEFKVYQVGPLAITKPYMTLTLMGIGIGVLVLVAYFVYSKRRQINLSLWNKQLSIRTNKIGLFQVAQLLTIKRAWIILVILAVYFGYTTSSYQRILKPEEIHFQQYRTKYFQEIDQSLFDKIAKEKEEYEILAKKVAAFAERIADHIPTEKEGAEATRLLNEYHVKKHILKVEQEVMALANANSRYYADYDGYQYLYDTKSDLNFLLKWGIVVMSLIGLMLTLVGNVYEEKMNILNCSTIMGKQKLHLINIRIILIGLCTSFIIVFGAHYFKLSKYFELKSAVMTKNIFGGSIDISLISLILINFVFVILIMYILSLLNYYLFQRVSQLMAIAICCVVFLIMAALYLWLPMISPLIMVSYKVLNYPFMGVVHLLVLSFVAFKLRKVVLSI